MFEWWPSDQVRAFVRDFGPLFASLTALFVAASQRRAGTSERKERRAELKAAAARTAELVASEMETVERGLDFLARNRASRIAGAKRINRIGIGLGQFTAGVLPEANMIAGVLLLTDVATRFAEKAQDADRVEVNDIEIVGVLRELVREARSLADDIAANRPPRPVLRVIH